jgi:hypothetical protein
MWLHIHVGCRKRCSWVCQTAVVCVASGQFTAAHIQTHTTRTERESERERQGRNPPGEVVRKGESERESESKSERESRARERVSLCATQQQVALYASETCVVRKHACNTKKCARDLRIFSLRHIGPSMTSLAIL